jgi:hypothetical protein
MTIPKTVLIATKLAGIHPLKFRTALSSGHRTHAEGGRIWRVPFTDRSPIYKSYWAQWKLLTIRNGILEHPWKNIVVLPWSRVNECWLNYTVGPHLVTGLPARVWIKLEMLLLALGSN